MSGLVRDEALPGRRLLATAVTAAQEPWGRKPEPVTVARVLVYVTLVLAVVAPWIYARERAQRRGRTA